ncbi:MAG: CDP-alcohol phosphatidyltransferase family protein [Thomasclavelia spiroformis]
MIGYYSYTVILTYLSLVFAMAGIHLSFNGMYQWAFICLIMCGICDAFDGMVARSKKNRTDEEKRFGIQIDSLCDLVAFGVFPAILGYNVGLSSIDG